MDIEKIMQLYDRLIENIEQFSLDPEMQIKKLRGTAVADEIALDFSNIGKCYAQKLLQEQWLTEKQYKMIEVIDEKLSIMSKNKQLWSEEALLEAEEWRECRKMGKEILNTLQ